MADHPVLPCQCTRCGPDTDYGDRPPVSGEDGLCDYCRCNPLCLGRWEQERRQQQARREMKHG